MLTVEEITRRLTPVFEAGGVTKAVLFGSYAKGTADEDSDVDLVIETEPYIRGIWIFSLFGDITETLGIDVDVFHRQDIIPGGKADFEIAQSGLVIYEKHR